MKPIKRLFCSIGALVLAIFMFFSIGEKNKAEAAGATIPNSNVSVQAIFSDSFYVERNGSNIMTALNGKTEFFVSFYLTTKSGLLSYQLNYDIDMETVEKVEHIPAKSVNKGQLINLYKLSAEKADAFIGDGVIELAGDGPANAISGRPLTIDSNYNTETYFDSDGNKVNGSFLTIAATDTNQKQRPNTTFLIGKFKVTLKENATSFSMKHNTWAGGGYDYPQETEQHKISALDVSIGAGSLSDSTDLSTKTVQGNNDTTPTTLSGTNPLSGEVSANSTTATLKLAVKDSGTIDSVKVGNSPILDSGGGTYSITLGATGSTTPVTVEVTAQDKSTQATYTVNIKRKKYSDNKLSGITFSATGSSYTPKICTTGGADTTFSPDTNSYKLKISDATTAINVSPTTTGQNITSIKVNNTVVASGSSTSILLSGVSTITVAVEAEDGTVNSYTFTLDKITKDTTVKTIEVYDSNGSTKLGEAEWNESDKAYVLSGVSYSNASGVINASVTFKIAPNKANTSMTLNGSSLNSGIFSGPNPFTSTTGATSLNATLKITDKDTSDTEEHKIIVKRDAAGSDATIDANDITITDSKGQTHTVQFNPGTGNFEVTSSNGIPYDDSSFTIAVSPNDGKAKVQIGNGAANVGTATGTVTVTGDTTSVTIKVTAEDGTTKSYTIDVNKGAADSNTDLAASNGIIVKKVDNSSLSGNLAGTIYTVTTKLDFNSNSVQVTVTLAKSTSSWHFKTVSGTTYTSGGTGTYTFDPTGSKNAGNFSFDITVTAQDGTTKDYTIKLEREGAKSDSSIQNPESTGILVEDVDGNTYQGTYNAATKTFTLNSDVPYKYNTLLVTVTLSDASVTKFTIGGLNAVSGDPKTITIGAASDKGQKNINIPIYVEAENGSSSTYSIVGKRTAAETNTDIANGGLVVTDNNDLNLTFTLQSDGKTYKLDNVLAFSITGLNITVTLDGAFAKLTINSVNCESGNAYSYSIPSGPNAINGTKIPIKVTAEDGSSTTYYVEYSRNAAETSNAVQAANVELTDDAGNTYPVSVNGSVFTIQGDIPYTVNTLYLKVTPDSALATLKYASETTVWDGTTPKSWAIGTAADIQSKSLLTTFKVTSESGSTKTYTIKGTRLGADNNNLLNVTVTGATTGTTYQSQTPTGALPDHLYYSVKTSLDAKVKFTFTNPQDTTTIEFSTTSGSSGFAAWENVVAQTEYEANDKVYYVRVTPQNNISKVYTIHINKADERDSDTTLSELTVEKANGDLVQEANNQVLDPANPKTYKFVVPYDAGILTFNVTATKATSKIYKDKNENAAVYQVDVSTLQPGTPNTYYFFVKAENDTWSSAAYIISIERSPGNSDAYLNDLKVNGQSLTDFSTSDVNKTYNVILAHGITNLNVVYLPYVCDDATAVLSGATSIVNGKATVTITVKSQDGTNVNSYTVNVYAAEQDNSISNIQLLDYDLSAIYTDSTGQEKYTVAVQAADNDGNQYFDFATANNIVNITVPYSVDKFFIDVTSNGLYAKVYGYGTMNLNVGINTRTVYVKSEYGEISGATGTTSTVYTFKITREAADTETRLKTFAASTTAGVIPTTDIQFNPDSTSISISNVDSSAGSITVTVELMSTKSKVSINGDTTGQKTKNVQITWPSASSGVFTFTIVVTAESGDSRTYNVAISRETIELDSNNEITNITITGSDSKDYSPNVSTDTFPVTKNVPGKLTSVSISVSTPAAAKSSVNIMYLLPDGTTQTIASNNCNVTLQTGNNTITVWAVAEDGTVGTKYIIILNKPTLSENNDLTSVTVDGTTHTSFPANAYLPSGSTSVVIAGNPADPKSTVTVQGADSNGTVSGLVPGINPVVVTVTSESGDPKTYVVNVWVDEKTDLGNLEVENYTMSPTFNPNQKTYNVTIPYNANGITIKYSLPDNVDASLLTVTGTGYKAVSASTSFEVKVTPKSGSTNENVYTINVTKETAQSGNQLLSVQANGKDIPNFNPGITTGYFVLYSRTTSSVSFSGITVSQGATYKLPTDLSLGVGINEKTITVTSEAGVTKDYKFTFICADSAFDILDIELKNTDGTTFEDISGNALSYNKNTLLYSLTVPNSAKTVVFSITKPQYGTLVINGVDMGKGSYTYDSIQSLNNTGTTTNDFSIYIKSEYLEFYAQATNAKSDTYTIKITRNELNKDNSLKDLAVSIGGSTTDANGNPYIQNFSPDNTGPYYISNIGDNIANIFISASPNVSTSTVSGTGNKTLLTGSQTGAYNFTFIVTVTAEDGSKREYEISVSRGAIDVDDDNTVTGIEVLDSNGTKHIDKENDFDPANSGPYKVTIPAGVASYTINVEKLSASPAVITGAGQFQTAGKGGQTITHIVYATSDSGQKGTEYRVEVTIEEPSTDNTLTSILVDGEALAGFDPDFEGPYSITREYAKDSITILATKNDADATITGNHNGNYPLQEGLNTFTITVTAQDGTQKTYVINVTRAYKDPTLLTLGVNGEALLDMNGKATTFDPEKYEYKVNVVYYHETADVYATSSNPTDIISGTGIKNLYVGKNTVVVTVTSVQGVSTEYTLTITRYSSESTNANVATAEILEIPEFKTEFEPFTTTGYKYTVNNNIDKLTVIFTPENNAGTAELGPATVTIYGAEQLYVGMNNIVIVVTAADGSTSKTYVVNVERKSMSYEVTNEAYPDFQLEDTDENNIFKLDIGNKKTSDVDYVKFIKDLDASNQNLKIEVLTNLSTNPDEVLVQITDGEHVDVVKFAVASTANPSTFDIMSLLPMFIALGIIVIILIAILISVNRDKYGKIVKKSNKKSDKEEQKDEKNRK